MTSPISQNAGFTLAQSLNAIQINPSGSLQFNPSFVGGPDRFVPIHENKDRFADLAGCSPSRTRGSGRFSTCSASEGS